MFRFIVKSKSTKAAKTFLQSLKRYESGVANTTKTQAKDVKSKIPKDVKVEAKQMPKADIPKETPKQSKKNSHWGLVISSLIVGTPAAIYVALKESDEFYNYCDTHYPSYISKIEQYVTLRNKQSQNSVASIINTPVESAKVTEEPIVPTETEIQVDSIPVENIDNSDMSENVSENSSAVHPSEELKEESINNSIIDSIPEEKEEEEEEGDYVPINTMIVSDSIKEINNEIEELEEKEKKEEEEKEEIKEIENEVNVIISNLALDEIEEEKKEEIEEEKVEKAEEEKVEKGEKNLTWGIGKSAVKQQENRWGFEKNIVPKVESEVSPVVPTNVIEEEKEKENKVVEEEKEEEEKEEIIMNHVESDDIVIPIEAEEEKEEEEKKVIPEVHAENISVEEGIQHINQEHDDFIKNEIDAKIKEQLSHIPELPSKDRSEELLRVILELQEELKKGIEQEGVRLYEALKLQKEELVQQSKESLEEEKETLKQQLEDEYEQQYKDREEELEDIYREKQEELRNMYEDAIDEYKYNCEKQHEGELLAEEADIINTWRSRAEDIKDTLEAQVSEERHQRITELNNVNDQLSKLLDALEKQETEIETQTALNVINKTALSLSYHLYTSKSIQHDIEQLKIYASEDPVIKSFIDTIPAGIVEHGLPPLSNYYVKYMELKKDAHVAARTPATSSLGGQMLGRVTASLVKNTVGLTENDPLRILEHIETQLKDGDLEGAYESGKKLEGEPYNILSQWLEDIHIRIQIEKAFELLNQHLSVNSRVE
ncbi:hypothetical protein WA158_002538 [Blastocystis sp. Blastoise]